MKAAGAAVRSAIDVLLREPLVHFVVLGGVLFGAYAILEPDRDEPPPPTEIRLTLDELAQLLTVFESKWLRAPTQDEFNAMVEDHIRQEILYREALALGLDENDIIVKRRMAQKMQFLVEDVTAAREPTTDELRLWYAENSDLFTMPARLSFRHLYFSPDRRGDHAQADAAAALVELAGKSENAELTASSADPFMFQNYYADRTPQAIAREFGPEFATGLARLPQGSWQGPIESGYGWHLVFVDSVVPGRVPRFEEIEQEIRTAWLGKQKEEAWRTAYEELRAKYKVLLPVPAEEAISPISGGNLSSGEDAQDSGGAL